MSNWETSHPLGCIPPSFHHQHPLALLLGEIACSLGGSFREWKGVGGGGCVVVGVDGAMSQGMVYENLNE